MSFKFLNHFKIDLIFQIQILDFYNKAELYANIQVDTDSEK